MITDFLINKGISKNRKQAEYLLVVIAIIILALAIWIMIPNKSNNGTTEVPDLYTE
jgi:hypothetical protein